MKARLLALLLATWAVATHGADGFVPAPAVALDVIDALPAVRAALARSDEAAARGEALRRGPHGFDLSVMPTVRHENRGTTYGEWEALLSHRLRLPRKAELDRQLGEVGEAASTLGIADARHGGARSLLGLWFGWLRAAGASALAAEQLELARAERAAIARRVAAGDLATLDAERAEAALAQAEGMLARAEGETARARVALEAQFPTLPLPAGVPAVPAPDGAADASEQAIVDGILADNHEIGIAEALARRQGLAAARADAERSPDPSVGLRVIDEARGNEQAVGLVLTIPFAGGGAAASAQAEQDLADAMAADAASVRDMVRAEALQLAVGASRLAAAWRAAARARDAADAALARMERAWQLGEAGFADVALARRAAQDARGLEWQARLDVHETRLRIEVDSHRLWSRHDDHEH